MDQIKHYKIVEKIGVGAMGTVYKALDTVLERHVAIKLMHPHLLTISQNDERFMREARSVAKLVHPNIVTIYEVGRIEQSRYIVMEYVAGTSLAQHINRDNSLPIPHALEFTVQILKGLEAAHRVGILHRDIKPDNILVTRDGTIKILDFGIAKMSAMKGITASGDVLGTIEYMPPEQMLGEDPDIRSDIYSVGVVLYQLLTHHLPYEGETPVAILYKQLNESPTPPSHYNEKVSNQLEQVILKALSNNREKRWEDARSFYNALNAIQHSFSQGQSSFPELKLPMEELSGNDHQPAFDNDSSTKLRSVFIGRQKELSTLITLFNRAFKGFGQTVVISGEAGVGKTTLAAKLQQYGKQNHAWTLYGASLYQDGMDAYLPYIEAFRTFFSTDSYSLPETERLQLKQLVSEKVPLLMEFTERFTTTFTAPAKEDGSPANPTQYNLLEGIRYLISFLATLRPIILILDDLQWADEASLRLFHYLSRHLNNSRVLLLGITRSDRYDLHQNGKPALIVDILSRMRREGTFTELSLKRLTREECDNLIDGVLTNTVFSEDFYELLFKETRGNPFFILETIKLLRENNQIVLKNGNWHDQLNGKQIEVPNRVEDVFLRQLIQLEEEEREILQIASVIGQKFDVSILSNVTEIPKIKLLKLLQRIERELEILSSTETGYQFEHPMLREILYNEIPGALAREYHRMIASFLENYFGKEFGALTGEVAHHFLKGGELTRAVPLLFQAGQRAFKISAYREACHFFEDLLTVLESRNDLLPESQSWLDLYFMLGISYEETGMWQNSLKAYRMLEQISQEHKNYRRLTDALLRIGRVYDKLGRWEKSMEKYQECVEVVKRESVPNVLSRVYNNMGVIMFQRGNHDEALTYFQNATEAVDSEMGENDKAHALMNLGIIYSSRGEYQLALQRYQQSLKIFDSRNNDQYKARVYHNIGITYSEMGELEKGIENFHKCLELARSVEDKHLRALTYVNIGKAYLEMMKYSAARKNTMQAYKIFKVMDDQLSLAEANIILGLISGRRGDFARAEKYLKESIAINEEKNFQEGMADGYLAYGTICSEFGYIDQARTYLKKAEKVYREINILQKAEEANALYQQLLVNPITQETV